MVITGASSFGRGGDAVRFCAVAPRGCRLEREPSARTGWGWRPRHPHKPSPADPVLDLLSPVEPARLRPGALLEGIRIGEEPRC